MKHLFSKISRLHSKFIESHTAPLITLLVISIFIRLILTFGSTGILWPDSFAYFRSAALMAKYLNFTWHEIYRTPLYPLFMSPFLAFGQNFTAGELIIVGQRLLGIASVVIFYLSFKKLFGTKVAFYSSLLFSIHSMQLYYETVVQTEVLFVFLLAASTYQAIRLFEKPVLIEALRLGLILGLLTLTRPLGQYTVLIFLLTLGFRHGFNKNFIKLSLASFLPFVFLLLPWMLINKTYYGFFGVSQDIGLNLFHRVIDIEKLEPTKESKYPQIHYIWTKVKHRAKSSYFPVYHQLRRQKVSPLKADLMLKTVALETLYQNPNTFLLTSTRMFFELFVAARNSTHFCGSEKGPYLCVPSTRNQSNKVFPNDARNLNPTAQKIVRKMFGFFTLPMWLISPLALLGALLFIKNHGLFDYRLILCLGLILCFTAMAALINVPEDRFRLPVDPFIFALALYCLNLKTAIAVFSNNKMSHRSVT